MTKPGREPYSKISGQPTTPSINLLPAEVLITIFHHVCDTFSPRTKIRYWWKLVHPSWNEPLLLSHVCSHWRRISVDLSLLWTHIELVAKGNPTRLETYIARSKQSPLNVYIPAHYPDSDQFLSDTVLPFLDTNAPRMRSLVVDSDAEFPSDHQYICASILSVCYERCTPGVLTEVSIDTSECICIDRSLDPIQKSIEDGRLTDSIIEDFWLPITFLQTTCCSVNWESKAYHGLTELRLHGSELSLSELMSILRSSPQLRVLELELDFFLPLDSSLSPIRLDHLETLILSNSWHIGPILQLIAPGLKPLSLSIPNPYKKDHPEPIDELCKFISRSNIVHLTVHRLKSSSEVSHVLSIMPAVRVLAIPYFSCDGIQETTLASPPSPIDSLYVICSSSSTWSNIKALVKKHNIQKLTLWQCDFAGKGGPRDSKKVPRSLYTTCSLVKVVPSSDPNPIEEWYPWN